MSARRWPIAAAATAAEIAPLVDLEPELAALAAEPATPEQLCDALVARGALAEAVRVLACALPRREAVFWAHQCARSAGPSQPADGQLLVLAERWLKAPDDPRGRDAFAVAEKAGMKSAAAWVAVACFWSGSSLAPEGIPAVPPAPGLAAKAASGAILLASASGPPVEAPQRLRRYLEIGEQVASGALRCDAVLGAKA